MTEKEARKQNLIYTGMSFHSWDREKREYYKNRVKEIKSIYNVRIVLVNDSVSWCSYYADENYDLIRGNKEEHLEKEINNIDTKRKELYEKYLKDLESLNNRHEENLETLKKIKAIRKDSK